MRTTRSGRAFVAAALAALVAAAHALPAQQRDAYPATLQFGTGLINIPVAWVSPNNADAWLQMSGKTINHYVDPSASNISTKWNTNISLDAHFLGRFSVGASAYSQNPEYGFFGQVLAIRPNQFGYVPGIALGIRNVGKFKHEDRLLVGHDIALNPADSTYDEMVSVFSGEFDTSPTLYGVATQEFRLASWGSLSVGYGNGLFSEDGGLGKNYNAKGQIAEGLFLGGRVVGHRASIRRSRFSPRTTAGTGTRGSSPIGAGSPSASTARSSRRAPVTRTSVTSSTVDCAGSITTRS